MPQEMIVTLNADGSKTVEYANGTKVTYQNNPPPKPAEPAPAQEPSPENEPLNLEPTDEEALDHFSVLGRRTQADLAALEAAQAAGEALTEDERLQLTWHQNCRQKREQIAAARRPAPPPPPPPTGRDQADAAARERGKQSGRAGRAPRG